jgi:hypothetical protein
MEPLVRVDDRAAADQHGERPDPRATASGAGVIAGR